MTQFEFFFSFYGLILGLALAQLLTGFANTLRSRGLKAVGVATALLASLLAFEIVIHWIAAWHSHREAATVAVRSMLLPFAVGSAFYVAAVMIFPSESDEHEDLDAYFLANKRRIATFMMLANLFIIAGEAPAAAQRLATGTNLDQLLFFYLPFNATIIAVYLVLMFARSRRTCIIAMAVLLAWYVYVTFLRGY